MTTGTEMNAFGNRLKQLMDERGFNQSTLARKSGVERTVINRLISGKAKPRRNQIDWVAQALGVDANDLLLHTEMADEVRALVQRLHDAATRIAELERARDEAIARAERLDDALRAARRRSRIGGEMIERHERERDAGEHLTSMREAMVG